MFRKALLTTAAAIAMFALSSVARADTVTLTGINGTGVTATITNFSLSGNTFTFTINNTSVAPNTTGTITNIGFSVAGEREADVGDRARRVRRDRGVVDGERERVATQREVGDGRRHARAVDAGQRDRVGARDGTQSEHGDGCCGCEQSFTEHFNLIPQSKIFGGIP